MFKFGLNNLRRLHSVEPIELKPLTILVGKNSSGKSTFLRCFPLISQSIKTDTSAPILWWGDLVDFGSFKEAVSELDSTKDIIFNFEFDAMRRFERWNRTFRSVKQFEKVSLNIYIRSFENKTRVARAVIRIGSPSVDIDLDIGDDGDIKNIIIDGLNATKTLAPFNLNYDHENIMPYCRYLVETEVGDAPRMHDQALIFVDPVKLIVKKYANSRAKDDTVRRISVDLLTTKLFNKNISNENGEFAANQKVIKNIIKNDNDRNKLRTYQVAALLPSIMSSIRITLFEVYTNLLYIKPARVNSDRYYRYQDLAVSEITPDGKNLPMFLNSLSFDERRDLSEWVKGLFGYGVELTKSGQGHLSIELTSNGSRTNIVDSGFAQIWWGRNRKGGPLFLGEDGSTTIAIEQPELHLHPAHQAMLADAFIGGAEKKGESDDVRFIIETHSEALINRVGELVAEGRIKKDDVQILIFQADDESRVSSVEVATFSPDGGLLNWPYGFFYPV
jgi:hypothetical protein